LNIIDTHAHLDMSQFDNDRDDVVARAKAAGINRIITIGIDLESSRQSVRLAEKYPGVLAAVGIHPQESKGIGHNSIFQLEEISRSPKVVGIGETGLDFYRNNAPREDQFQVFQCQLELAQTRGLPVIIHSRQALEETLGIIKTWSAAYNLPSGKPRGVIHCFSGDPETALEYIELGFYISIGGYIGYPSSARLREAIVKIPGDRLVVETDCPFLPPQKFRGKRNEPAYTRIILEVLAGIKQISTEEMAAQTTRNAETLFNL
jgi:TatD DNase family protein